MTEFIENASNASNKEQNDDDKDGMEFIVSSDSEDSNPKSESSSTTSSGSWSIDDSIEFMQTSHKPMFDELPTFSLRSTSPHGLSLSPIDNEPISLFNLSISPISSIEDLTSDQSVCASNCFLNGKSTKDVTESNITTDSSYDDEDRISLEEITAHINTPPSAALSRSNKRLNLETIFEDVFLETPKKRRFNANKRFNSWRIEKFQEITSEERISSYVFEQQNQNHNEPHARSDTNILCNAFDNKINLNT